MKHKEKLHQVSQQIAELENKRKELMKFRADEIGHISLHCGGFDVRNEVIAGFFVYASDIANKDNEILKQFSNIGRGKKIPRYNQPGQSKTSVANAVNKAKTVKKNSNSN